MPLTAKTIRAQLTMLRPLLRSCSLETIRRGQDKLGELMENRFHRQVLAREHGFEQFQGAWIIPKDERRQGVILYLHGGGYTCGSLEYAKGFASMLAAQCGARVFCCAYRLAPEHPFPAALEDALECYRYLLQKGYTKITVCGESAGGGLCYSLCLKLRELGLLQPKGIIAISPWVDLTASGDSYQSNRDRDPSLSAEQLEYYTTCYTDRRTDPLVSPILADLTEFPPSIIFAGGDEILLSDAQQMHRRLEEAGCRSKLLVKPERWHAYLLFGLQEDQKDFERINEFLSNVMCRENKLRWMRLDNAAKIYPAARRQNWSNVFRLSATLTETVDVAVMQRALDVTVRRFPSIATRLRRGVFWYYLQQLSEAPRIREESSFPLTRMSRDEVRKCALRVIVYGNRVAVELFHSLTDGSGAMIFLKSLVAEYLQQKYEIRIPAACGVLGRLEEPDEEELEDSFLKYAGNVAASRRESNAWRIKGTLEPDGFLHLTCFELPVDAVREKARTCGVSVTAFLCAAMMMAIQNLQKQRVPYARLRRPIKVLIPVNLRRIFPSKTLRNFALYTTPEIDPRLGAYDFAEICQIVRHRMGLEVNAKQMSAKIATNVGSERNLLVKVMPLFMKNTVMKLVFDAVGEKKSCLSLSNLGNVELPEPMRPYVARMDFILGVQASAPYNCGVLSYDGTLYMNFIRDIKEPELEYHFHRVLQELGIPAQVCSNGYRE